MYDAGYAMYDAGYVMRDRGSGRGGCRAGFTLIEILVSMAVLSLIAVAVSNLFTHSSTAWDTGFRRIESAMVGRALVDYYARESFLALCDQGGYGVPSPGGFAVLKGTDVVDSPTLNLNQLFEGQSAAAAGGQRGLDASLATFVFEQGPDPIVGRPLYARVRVDVVVEDRGHTFPTVIHTGRAYLINRNRYRFD